MKLRSPRLSTSLASLSLAVGILVLVLVTGCGKPEAGKNAPPSPAARAVSPVVTPGEEISAARPDEEIWEVHQAQGSRLGYTQTTIRQVHQEGRPLVRIDCVARLAIQRFDRPMETEIRITGLETPEGQLVEFSTTSGQGAAAMASQGRVEGGKLRVRITSTGKTLETSIPWAPHYGGIQAVEQSLARAPMRPGERRTIHAFDPSLNDVGVNELIASIRKSSLVSPSSLTAS